MQECARNKVAGREDAVVNFNLIFSQLLTVGRDTWYLFHLDSAKTSLVKYVFISLCVKMLFTRGILFTCHTV